jgi:hypothetical protein
MATIIAPFTAVDGNGHVRANAKLYLYQTGTSTPQNSFSDAALSVTNTNPVVADSNGLFTAIYLGEEPDFEAYKAILKTSADVTVWTTDPFAGAPVTSPISSALLRGYLAGLQRTANTTTTLTLGAGVAMDDTSTSMLSLPAGTINFATVGADGLDAGALASNTTYHIFAIGKTDGTVARLASTSPSSPTMPSGYTLKRRISSCRTEPAAATIRNYTQVGDEFTWSATVSTTVGNFSATAVTTIALHIPTGVKMEGKFRVIGAAGTPWGIVLYSPDQVTQVGGTPPGNWSLANAFNNGQAAGEFRIRTDTSGQIKGIGTAAGEIILIGTYGWVDQRGRDD